MSSFFTPLFWDIYFYAMIITFVLFPITNQQNGGFKSLIDITIRDLIIAAALGCVPIVNVLVAALHLIGLTAYLVWDLFTGNWGDVSLRSIFSKKDKNW